MKRVRLFIYNAILATLGAQTTIAQSGTGACCGADGSCFDQVDAFICAVEFIGDYQGDGTTCDTTTCTQCSPPCDDGNRCNGFETCVNSTCVAGTPLECNFPYVCETAVGAFCDPKLGYCVYPLAPDNTACDDGDACTVLDFCSNGVCLPGDAKSCNAQTQCQSQGTCDPQTSQCVYPTLPNGTACSDGNACTLSDSCTSGICVGGAPKTCIPTDQCHSAGTCDPMTGACSNPALANGTACNDGNACTLSDSCTSGICVGGAPKTCIPTDQCHSAGTCDPMTGACSNPALANGTACSDGNACTLIDSCMSGICVGGAPKTCIPTDQCHFAGTCDPMTGACSNPALANGTACNDGNACTLSDSCTSGICVGGAPKTCIASDQCHFAGTCDPMTGACSNPALANETACNDGNACTLSDSCTSGICVGGAPKTCIPTDQCHSAGTCDPMTGACSNPPLADGTVCAQPCAVTAMCSLGVCVGTVVSPPCVNWPLLFACLHGPSVVPGAECIAFDFVPDGRIDLRDFSIFIDQ